MFGLPLAYAIFRLVPVDTSHRDLLTMVAMSAVAAVMVHRVYASHTTAQSRLRSRILIFGTALLLVRWQHPAGFDPHAQVVGYYQSPTEAQLEVPRDEVIGQGLA